MAISYVNRKCDCGGKLEYDKSRNVWVCIYCGSEMEREEQYDGMFTIKNVVRQTLLDISYMRLDNAENNLVECEKIDSHYIGTIIANLCFLVIKITNTEACDQSEVKGIIGKIKRYNDIIQSQYEDITDEEDGLYEFFDTSDIYATLMLVYDSLNDKKRGELMRKLLKVEQVFSIETNKNLLIYSLKNENLTMVDEIVNNSNNLDLRFTLIKILNSYPDGNKKRENISKLLEETVLTKEDKQLVVNYFNTTEDSMLTKYRVVEEIYSVGMKLDIDTVFKKIININGDILVISDILSEVCNSKLTDEEVYKIVNYCYGINNIDVSLLGLLCLKNSGNYVDISQKQITSLLGRTDMAVDDKVRILEASYQFNIDMKSREAIINSYLCFNEDNEVTRRKIISFLLKNVKTIQTSTFENYVLKNNIDGNNKCEIVKSVLEMDINISFYYNLLSNYMLTDIDDIEIKEKIIDMLLDKGIKIEPKAFNKYICSSNDKGDVKIKFIKKIIKNGTTFNSDILSNYLQNMTNFNDFDSDLFQLLMNDFYNVTDNAIVNYILYCKDRQSVKVKNAINMSKTMSKQFGSQSCSIKHNDNIINCNLLQAYILISSDSFNDTLEIIREMVNANTKINSEIVISGGKELKFKKYVIDNRGSLSSMTEEICKEYKLFNKLFGLIN